MSLVWCGTAIAGADGLDAADGGLASSLRVATTECVAGCLPRGRAMLATPALLRRAKTPELGDWHRPVARRPADWRWRGLKRLRDRGPLVIWRKWQGSCPRAAQEYQGRRQKLAKSGPFVRPLAISDPGPRCPSVRPAILDQTGCPRPWLPAQLLESAGVQDLDGLHAERHERLPESVAPGAMPDQRCPPSRDALEPSLAGSVPQLRQGHQSPPAPLLDEG